MSVMNSAKYFSRDALRSLPEVLVEWRRARPRTGVVFLLPEVEQARVAAIQAAGREADVPVIGAIFPALLGSEGFLTEGAWALCYDPMPPWFLIDRPDASQPLSARELCASVHSLITEQPAGDSAPTLFLVFDGMVPNVSTILLGLFEEFGRRVRYGGVNAGSETFQPMPCLFDGRRIVGNGVLGLMLPASTHVLARHAYPVSKSLMRATTTTGNRIDQIDGRLAFDVYRQLIQSEYGITVTQDNFYNYAVHFPFGVVTALDVLVRIPVALTDDGALFCVGEVPPSSILRLLRAPSIEESDCIDVIAKSMGSGGGIANGAPLLAFYCAGRRMHFGVEDANKEVVGLMHRVSPAGLAGALSLGEIDTDEEMGMPRFQNAAMVCLTDRE
jgi:hypothetical protein